MGRRGKAQSEKGRADSTLAVNLSIKLVTSLLRAPLIMNALGYINRPIEGHASETGAKTWGEVKIVGQVEKTM